MLTVSRGFDNRQTSGDALVQPTVSLAQAARNRRWIHGLALKGADAIHVASALERKCDEFITRDGKGLPKRAESLAGLNLRICRPSATPQCRTPQRRTSRADAQAGFTIAIDRGAALRQGEVWIHAAASVQNHQAFKLSVGVVAWACQGPGG
jgi:hypothetical protein